MRRHWWTMGLLGVILVSMFFVCLPFGLAAESDRQAQWYRTDWVTGPLGQVTMIGTYGPDPGFFGEQGTIIKQFNPLTGSYTVLQFEGMGVNGFPLFGYGGKYNPVIGPASYGPYFAGAQPFIAPTPGWITQGSVGGSLWGYSQYYNAVSLVPFPMRGYGFGRYWAW